MPAQRHPLQYYPGSTYSNFAHATNDTTTTLNHQPHSTISVVEVVIESRKQKFIDKLSLVDSFSVVMSAFCNSLFYVI